MGRLIEAEKLWKAITTQIEEYCDITDLAEIIETQPTVDAEPVRHGRWEYWSGNLYRCSCCGKGIADDDDIITGTMRYCHYCGAKMDGERREDG